MFEHVFTSPKPASVSCRGRRGLLAALLAGSALLLAGCAATLPPPGVTPVSPFEVQRYEGRWYELARLDHSFERGMTDVSATYTAQADGSVQVINRGYAPSTGKWREAVGKALFIGSPTTASLKVSFFGPFYGGYHVAALDPDYRWALVLGNDTGYAWILARDKQLSAAQRDAIVAQAQALGVDTSALIWVSQERKDPRYDPSSAATQ
ncbi:lipocalin family protein [Bordetella avium]|nr:lipocalin family protein [Bordetella avium]AZY50763.1 lipocalin [Bordetella avium]AZY51382.1 lipocalin [Bordetella avium]RIQ15599.1 lipocalin [Bordetella avium]RIQ18752.1 lipocalin [Bordetella avium]RIQ35213.1 lipocalin [Bordetella avium]